MSEPQLGSCINLNKKIIYNKIPKSQIVQRAKQQSIDKWQTQWEQTTKGSILCLIFRAS
jgi:hypothetical protein